MLLACPSAACACRWSDGLTEVVRSNACTVFRCLLPPLLLLSSSYEEISLITVLEIPQYTDNVPAESRPYPVSSSAFFFCSLLVQTCACRHSLTSFRRPDRNDADRPKREINDVRDYTTSTGPNRCRQTVSRSDDQTTRRRGR